MSERVAWEKFASNGSSMWWADCGKGYAARVEHVRGSEYRWSALEWEETDNPDWRVVDSGTSGSLEWAKRKARETAQGMR